MVYNVGMIGDWDGNNPAPQEVDQVPAKKIVSLATREDIQTELSFVSEIRKGLRDVFDTTPRGIAVKLDDVLREFNFREENRQRLKGREDDLQHLAEQVQALHEKEEREKAAATERRKERFTEFKETGDKNLLVDYDKTRFVGNDKGSNVYPGVLVGGFVGLRNPDSIKFEEIGIAVKVSSDSPFDSSITKELLEEEHKNMTALRNKQRELFPNSPMHFPDSEIVMLPYGFSGKPALVMEIIPYTDRIRPIDTVEQLRSAMVQHFEVAAVTHALGLSMQREFAGNINTVYIPEEDRYVALGWTRLKPTDDTLQISQEKSRKMAENLQWALSDRLGLPRWKLDLIDGLKRFIWERPDFPYQKLELLQKRVQNREDQTTALDLVNILKKLDEISEEEIGQIKKTK